MTINAVVRAIRAHHLILGAIGAALLIAILPARPASAITQADLSNYRDWGSEVAGAIENDLRHSNAYLYAEAATLDGAHPGGINGHAFIWAASVQLRARNSMVELNRDNPSLRAAVFFSDNLHQRYWEDSSDGENGYVVAPGSTERYYDDNAHMTVALMEGYELTGVERLLDRAIATHAFVLEGEDSHQGGGIYFREGSFGNKNTISTLQEARGAAMLYQATGQQEYLDDAVRLLEWSNSHVQRSDGLYYQEYREEGIGDISNVPLTNGAGMGILTNLEMYDITGDTDYLDEANRVGLASARIFRTASDGHVWGGGYWAFELVDAWADLYRHTGSRRFLAYASGAVEFLKENIEDDNGHYGRDWHAVTDDSWPELDEWLLIDQASVARAYLYTGLSEAPGVPGDYNDDGQVDAADYVVWRDSLGEPDGSLPNDPTGGVIGQAQYLTWRDNYGRQRGTLPESAPVSTRVSVPEPSGAFLLLIGGLGIFCHRAE